MNWLQKISENYFEQGIDWGYGHEMDLEDKLLELFKVEYVIGELKHRGSTNQRLQYNKRYSHWLNKLEDHARDLAYSEVGPEVLRHMEVWMNFHGGSGFAETLFGDIDDDGNESSSVDEDGVVYAGGNFSYDMGDEVIECFLYQNPAFVDLFISDQINQYEEDPELQNRMTDWDLDQQIKHMLEYINDVGYDFNQTKDWFSEFGDFRDAIIHVLKTKIYPVWRAYWGHSIEVAEKNVNEAIQRLSDALQKQDLGNLLANINLALNAQHVHGGMYTNMDLSRSLMDELSNLNTDKLDEFVNQITGPDWTTASSWLQKFNSIPENFPDHLMDDVNLLRDEQHWKDALTPGSLVQHDSGWIGTIIALHGNPVNGGKVLVEHKLDGIPVKRLYSALELSPVLKATSPFS